VSKLIVIFNTMCIKYLVVFVVQVSLDGCARFMRFTYS